MDFKRIHSGSLSGESLHPRKKSCRVTRLNLLICMVLCAGFALLGLNVYQLHQMREEHLLHAREDHPITIVEGQVDKPMGNPPVVWIQGKRIETGYLNHVKIVFERLGFFVTHHGDVEWDVLWAHDYPFVTLKHALVDLQPHQRVNHFPGSGYITNKGILATMQLDAFPKCFRIPKDRDKLEEYAKLNPGTMWVQKNNNHRGIRIKQIEELDLNSEGSFIQEFISKPLLIDKRKFDIGVYVVMTSLSPLRVYMLEDESLFRFCPENYYPFDKDNVNKYVVHDAYTPMWKIPSLQQLYTEQNYSFKETFNRYMKNQGYNVSKIWEDIHSTILAVYLKKHPSLMQAGTVYKSTRNFFELVRFDFMLDENLKLYLMEVNMSPNLSTNHFMGNKRLYQHVIYNVLRVARIASMVYNQFSNIDADTDEMLASDREITVFSEWCSMPECAGKQGCGNLRCALCTQCLHASQKVTLREAYLEHYNRGGCHRLIPPAIGHEAALTWSPENPDTDAFGLQNQRGIVSCICGLSACAGKTARSACDNEL
ncbi:probable tubulin polyglutamylase ttll-15 isoform X8 [Dreissena polymorpha]|uniref:probable tubulin polyglutamylase ttll-15 isoform X5 n=1 Tax=Dreissena polymorpha TaxID=45954 RepID=UPI002264DB7B|nr:probable tubulin polyglutamylase ttll-15 isoform X5 [Dreissena polymorpha]XP_052219729.1 probable tubulin polyglutamylase ttll-15 isoform X6 [Dreissena polymorpha]XP_052219730.1 probable tubulin polyglutamylase ttll-15 isoform X7 [Dreissena polymorpha]XP_052219731.1 probable tubulin polyglutamylase ttll-15 isoform X8 [Dreissena polymorpha]